MKHEHDTLDHRPDRRQGDPLGPARRDRGRHTPWCPTAPDRGGASRMNRDIRKQAPNASTAVRPSERIPGRR
jgi:hypothetical protein